MQITVMTTRFSSAHSEWFAKATAGAKPLDEEAVERLCKRLTGLSDDKDEIVDELIGCPMPEGVRGVRVFDARNGVEFASSLSTRREPIKAAYVSLLVTFHDLFDTHRWTRTEPLPSRDPGILDLLVWLEPRIPTADQVR